MRSGVRVVKFVDDCCIILVCVVRGGRHTPPPPPLVFSPLRHRQAHGAEEFRRQVMEQAVPWSDWQGDRILAEHDFAGDANDFRRCADRLTGFISDLSIPADQTFHVHRFAKALAGGGFCDGWGGRAGGRAGEREGGGGEDGLLN